MSTPLKVVSIMRRETTDQPWYETTQEFSDYFHDFSLLLITLCLLFLSFFLASDGGACT